MVTNLNKFPSRLNLVEVPDGDIHECLPKMYISVDLKKLGCAGRSAVSLTHLVETQEKFRGLFHTHAGISFDFSVLELVRLTQKALCIHGYLHPSFECDGLLCDVTQEALRSFISINGPFGNEEGIYLVPKLLFHLLSTVMIVKNNLHFLSIQVPKDPFADNHLFRKSIQGFQESKGLAPTGFPTTDVIAAIEKACKKLKISIHHVSVIPFERDTGDYENFVDCLNVDRVRYLWLGKGKSQGDSIKISKVFKQGLSELTKPSVGFLKGVGEGVAETFSSKVDELVDSYRSVRGSSIIPHRRDKDKDRGEKDAKDSASNSGGKERSDKDRTYSALTQKTSRDGEFPLSPTELSLKDREELAPPPEKGSEAFPEVQGEFAGVLSEGEEALQDVKEKDFEAEALIRRLQDLSRTYDEEIALVRAIYDKDYRFYQSLERKVTEQSTKNATLNNSIEKMDLNNSICQYQGNTATEKLKETEENLDNFSKLGQELDVQFRKTEVPDGTLFWVLHLSRSFFLLGAPSWASPPPLCRSAFRDP